MKKTIAQVVGVAHGMKSRIDKWSNALTGLGTIAHDKAESFIEDGVIMRLDWITLEAMYHNSHVSRKIVAKPSEKIFSKKFKLNLEDSKLETRVLNRAEELGLIKSFSIAKTWEGTYGGAAIFMGADDGQALDQPLNMDRVKAVKFLHVFDAPSLPAHSWQADPNLPGYGMPDLYSLVPRAQTRVTDPNSQLQSGTKIHASRLIIFPGLPVSTSERYYRQGWGQSKLENAYEAIRTFQGNWSSIRTLIHEASQGVFKINGLAEIMGGENAEIFEKRMHLTQVVRGVARALLLDADGESFERVETSFTGLPELLDRSAQLLASAADMPVTVLMGREPAGMNATGDGDLRNWYDSLEAERQTQIVPMLNHFVRILLRIEGQEPETWTIVFPPLWTPTPSELADLRLKQAQTDAILITNGQWAPEEVTLARWKPEGYQDELTLPNYEDKLAELDLLGATEMPAADPTAEPGAAPEAAAPAGVSSREGLTGIQISSMLAILESIRTRLLTPPQGIQALKLAFPDFTDADILPLIDETNIVPVATAPLVDVVAQ